jgi:hypothetical protein
MAAGHCPECKRTIDHALFEQVNVHEHPRGKAWIALSFLCPSCRAVLGMQIDPVALNGDLLDAIERARKG